MDLSSWMLKGSTLTSKLNSERIPFLQNTLTTSQTPVGPSILVYFTTSDASMFRTLAISDSMFSSTHTTTPCRSFLLDEDTSPSLYALLLVQTFSLHQGLLQIVYHLSCAKPV